MMYGIMINKIDNERLMPDYYTFTLYLKKKDYNEHPVQVSLNDEFLAHSLLFFLI